MPMVGMAAGTQAMVGTVDKAGTVRMQATADMPGMEVMRAITADTTATAPA